MSRYNLQLRTLRKNRGLTIAELAEKIGVSFQIVGNWERGSTEINLADALKVCEVLECSIDDLAGWNSKTVIEEKEKRSSEACRKIKEILEECRV